MERKATSKFTRKFFLEKNLVLMDRENILMFCEENSTFLVEISLIFNRFCTEKVPISLLFGLTKTKFFEKKMNKFTDAI